MGFNGMFDFTHTYAHIRVSIEEKRSSDRRQEACVKQVPCANFGLGYLQ